MQSMAGNPPQCKMLAESWPEDLDGANSQFKETKKEWGVVRAEALSSAIFYGECALNKVCSDGAAHAEEDVRKNQSKWWLPGYDPNHPALRRSPTSEASRQIENVSSVAAISNATTPRPHRQASTDLLDANEHEVDDITGPLFARDDDLGSMPSLHLPNTDKLNQPLPFAHHVPDDFKSISAQSTTPMGCKKTLVSPRPTVFGNAEDAIRPQYFRIHGATRSQGQCKRPRSIPSEKGDTAPAYTKMSTLRDFDPMVLCSDIKKAKAMLLSNLKENAFATTDNKGFFDTVATLERLYQAKMTQSQYAVTPVAKKMKSRPSDVEVDQHACIDGTWLMISPPAYPACLGVNDNGERMFTLGRMTFDMFQPYNFVCSIQKQYNTIRTVTSDEKLPAYIPPSLRQEAENEHKKHRRGQLKAHNIIATFTIEQGSTCYNNKVAQGKQKKLKGLLTNYGYTLPDPKNPNRKSIWFTAGTIEPSDEESLEGWRELFGENSSDSSSAQYTEKARSLASEILLGAVSEKMDEHGTAGYYLTQPIGGHGYAYCDVVFMDEQIRVMRGHCGSVLVFQRVFV